MVESAAGPSGKVPAALRALGIPLVLAGLGLLAGQWLAFDIKGDGGWYGLLSSGLLAIGLYGSARGIARPHSRSDIYRIVVAITVGVVAKAAFIAGVLRLAFPDHQEYLVLAVAMAQIDPLSVSAMLENRDMSPRAKSLLAAWASFDDPVTTVLVVILGSMVLENPQSITSGTQSYAVTLLGNLGLLVAAAGLWWLVRDTKPSDASWGSVSAGSVSARQIAQYGALAAVLAVAVWQFWMLGLALSALFFRPRLGAWLDRATGLALVVATLLLGILLARGADFAVGALLGAATFTAQIVVASLVGLGLSRRDRISLCFSQQNGITAIILALLLEPRLPDAVAIIAPAILVVNMLHVGTTGVLGQIRTARMPVVKAGPSRADEATAAHDC
ncbi:hypothetical protein ABT052_12210 [Streptomyces sp. NPDC002766]|uniref:hypothetical protein n=1 Tax=Streptomyces sp. NPDC002766 TaxID=3154429 RepID=UPI00331821A5